MSRRSQKCRRWGRRLFRAFSEGLKEQEERAEIEGGEVRQKVEVGVGCERLGA